VKWRGFDELPKAIQLGRQNHHDMVSLGKGTETLVDRS
jgi:hypothetical protein